MATPTATPAAAASPARINLAHRFAPFRDQTTLDMNMQKFDATGQEDLLNPARYDLNDTTQQSQYNRTVIECGRLVNDHPTFNIPADFITRFARLVGRDDDTFSLACDLFPALRDFDRADAPLSPNPHIQLLLRALVDIRTPRPRPVHRETEFNRGFARLVAMRHEELSLVAEQELGQNTQLRRLGQITADVIRGVNVNVETALLQAERERVAELGRTVMSLRGMNATLETQVELERGRADQATRTQAQAGPSSFLTANNQDVSTLQSKLKQVQSQLTAYTSPTGEYNQWLNSLQAQVRELQATNTELRRTRIPRPAPPTPIPAETQQLKDRVDALMSQVEELSTNNAALQQQLAAQSARLAASTAAALSTDLGSMEADLVAIQTLMNDFLGRRRLQRQTAAEDERDIMRQERDAAILDRDQVRVELAAAEASRQQDFDNLGLQLGQQHAIQMKTSRQEYMSQIDELRAARDTLEARVATLTDERRKEQALIRAMRQLIAAIDADPLQTAQQAAEQERLE